MLTFVIDRRCPPRLAVQNDARPLREAVDTAYSKYVGMARSGQRPPDPWPSPSSGSSAMALPAIIDQFVTRPV
jgi:hypothetical protein